MTDFQHSYPLPGDEFATRERGRVVFWRVQQVFGSMCWGTDEHGHRRSFSSSFVQHSTALLERYPRDPQTASGAHGREADMTGH